jgi:hypothetical protein
MTLVHKSIDVETIAVDPYGKSIFWLEISRSAAMAPVLLQPDHDG